MAGSGSYLCHLSRVDCQLEAHVPQSEVAAAAASHEPVGPTGIYRQPLQ